MRRSTWRGAISTGRPSRVIGVVDDLRGRVALPRHHRRASRSPARDACRGRRGHSVELVVVLGVVAGDGLGEDRARHRHGRGVEELLHRHHLAAGDAGLVGDDAFDVLDAAGAKPVCGVLPGLYPARHADGGRDFGRACSFFDCRDNDFLFGRHETPGLVDDDAIIDGVYCLASSPRGVENANSSRKSVFPVPIDFRSR
jgi:hypothetical protein